MGKDWPITSRIKVLQLYSNNNYKLSFARGFKLIPYYFLQQNIHTVQHGRASVQQAGCRADVR